MIVPIVKKLVFEEIDTGFITQIEAHIQNTSTVVDIRPFLLQLDCPDLSEIEVLVNHSMRFQKIKKIPLNSSYYIDGKYFELDYTFFLYRKKKIIIEKNSQFFQKQLKKTSKTKKIHKNTVQRKEANKKIKQQRQTRCKQRTILEVIQIVKKWRDTHVGANNIGREKVSLKEAADKVGVSKKTLDDYYYQLRIGELKGFDFINNLQNKIGSLRNFIKDYERGDKTTQYHKHPKKLEVIAQFAQRNQQFKQLLAKQGNVSTVDDLQDVQNFLQDEMGLQDVIDLYESRDEMIKAYQGEFFGNFEFGLEDPNDPFLTFEKILFENQINRDPLFDQLQ